MTLTELNEKIIACERCSRLVEWREKVAIEKVKRFANEDYWGKAVPGFGDLNPQLMIVGLAPAAHGANRTGRMFTGDRSGDWLYRALHKFGFANQPESSSLNDGLTLKNCYISAVVHCAPPQNKPSSEERANCFSFFEQELQAADRVQVVIALGKLAFDTTIKAFRKLGLVSSDGKARFGHNLEFQLKNELTLLGSYHPSQQNTFTGRLTEPMFDTVFERARKLLSSNR